MAVVTGAATVGRTKKGFRRADSVHSLNPRALALGRPGFGQQRQVCREVYSLKLFRESDFESEIREVRHDSSKLGLRTASKCWHRDEMCPAISELYATWMC